jgi:hypothetical protein
MVTGNEKVTATTVYGPATLTLEEGDRHPVTVLRPDQFQSPTGFIFTNVIVEAPNGTESAATDTGTSGSTAATQTEASAIVSSTDPEEPSATDTTARTGTTSPTATSEPSADGLAGGAVAGVAIGCLIAGLALGLIAAFILLRKRRRGKPASEGFVLADQKYTEPKDGTQVIVSSPRHDAELSQFLLEATPDKEIQAELRSLSELIYQHVENGYREPQVQADPVEVAQSLINIGYSPESSGLQADTVAAVCLNPKTSKIGLRHVLSHVIFRSLDFSSGSSLSMLPLAVAALVQGSHSAENANNPGKTILHSPRARL